MSRQNDDEQEYLIDDDNSFADRIVLDSFALLCLFNLCLLVFFSFDTLNLLDWIECLVKRPL